MLRRSTREGGIKSGLQNIHSVPGRGRDSIQCFKGLGQLRTGCTLHHSVSGGGALGRLQWI